MPTEVTLALQRIAQGDRTAEATLLPLVYDELRKIAGSKMARERTPQTLQPTALVHEAWLRLGGENQPLWENRRHFFSAAAEAMRRILIEQSRRRQAVRHGAGQDRVELDHCEIASPTADTPSLLALSDALEKLSQLDAAKAELVKLRYFAGLTIEEAAASLNISTPTAKRWWRFSRAWLLQEMQSHPA